MHFAGIHEDPLPLDEERVSVPLNQIGEIGRLDLTRWGKGIERELSRGLDTCQAGRQQRETLPHDACRVS